MSYNKKNFIFYTYSLIVFLYCQTFFLVVLTYFYIEVIDVAVLLQLNFVTRFLIYSVCTSDMFQGRWLILAEKYVYTQLLSTILH